MKLIRHSFRLLGRGFRLFRRYLLIIFIGLCLNWRYCLPTQLFSDPTCTVLEDSKGNLLGARIADDGQWRFPHNENVPEKFRQAIIQFEDRDFYDHMGFSGKAFARAIRQNLQSGRVVSGGSTLTMQLVRLIRKGKSRSMWEKAVEVFMATRLERTYTKDEILAYYASNAPFGGNVVGLDAAAWRYYGRSAEELSWSEAATLAVLPNAPSLIYPGKNQQRLLEKRNRLLDRLHEVGQIDETGLMLAKAEPLPGKPHPLPQMAPHLLDRLSKEGYTGKRVKTTIDRELQENATELVAIHHRRLAENEIHNAAALVLKVKTGEVLAYIGNTDTDSPEHGSFVDVITAPRSTGSILKPFLFACMLDDGKLTPRMLIKDVPSQYGSYSPRNFNLTYDGAVPARKALARSLNVPAVRMLNNYGIEKFHHQLKRLGMTTLHRSPREYGLSLVLGGAEGTLWDLASIYANLARTLNEFPSYHSSLRARPRYIRDVEGLPVPGAEIPILCPSAIWHTYEAMLEVTRPESDINWRAFSNSNKIAWKTGTSFGFRDAWAIGVTPEYVVAVWVGNADGEGRPGLVGIEAAAPLMFDIFDRLPSGDWFHPPYDDMSRVNVCRLSGHRASELCQVVDSVYLPNPSLKTIACPYHQLVHLDKSGKYRVHSECELATDIRHESWFVLPPVMEWYYKFRHPAYRSLPDFRSDCHEAGEEEVMAIIYPKKASRIFVPVELSGEPGKTVFEITHRKASSKVFWHLDDDYIGTTRDIHHMEFRPGEGKHVLTLVDEEGNHLSRSFEVLSKK